MDLQVVLKAKNEATAAFNSLHGQLSKTDIMASQTAKNLRNIGLAAGAMGVALGKKAIDAAMEFEEAMSNVSTLLDTNTEDMAKMKNEILEMSKKTPVPLNDLATALYDVRSAGIEAEGAMNVLNDSARLAVGGLGSTQEATDIMTSAINAFGLEASNSAQIADVFFKAVKYGKTTVAELAQGFGQVAPLAKQAGISFEDLLSSVSAMTTSGLKASVAYTQVRAAVSNLLKPTKDMEEAMAAAGITSENLSATMGEKGLKGVFELLSNAVGGNQEQMAKMFGSVEGLNAVMMLLGDTGITQTEIFNDMTGGVNALDEAVNKQNQDYAKQYQILKNQLNAELVKLGTAILPKVIEAINAAVLIAQEWKSWFMAAADAIGTVIFKLQQAYEWAQKAQDKVKGFVTGSRRGEDNIPILPFFDSGGIVPGPKGSPQLVVAHAGETILPTHKNSAAGLAGNNYVINITGNTLLDDDAGTKIGKQIVRELGYNLKFS